jgi:hypothetical protein
MDRVISGICILIGGYWAYKGFSTYGIWVDKGPGGGFLPVVIGLLVIILSLAQIIRSLKLPYQKIHISGRILIPIITCVASVILTEFLGLVVTMTLMTIFWLKVIEKYSLLRSIITGLATGAFLYGVFTVWLQVIFPKGFLGI